MIHFTTILMISEHAQKNYILKIIEPHKKNFFKNSRTMTA